MSTDGILHAALTSAQHEVTASQTGGVTGLLLSGLISGAVLAAVIGALANTALARRKSLEEERARVRTVFAEAFEAVAAYKEFPYAIRRRRADQPAEERIRLSEDLRKVQARLTYYCAWTLAESPAVGHAYGALVRDLRAVAGGACREAWQAEPITADRDMNIGPDLVDLSALTSLEEAYTSAVETHLSAFLRRRSLWRRTS
ncbi:hypothetical protein [Terrabacter sp. Soil811]|uniref:hypothetical protein n=1 Tax=Terrabacter sp. Soil811 TaxID=1736419 RepID=UPI000AB87B54|nr:hypothetical protein [Terrabacter sp. Soil811]